MLKMNGAFQLGILQAILILANRMNPRRLFTAIAVGSCVLRSLGADPFAAGVRTTEPLAPAKQQQTFKLPPGFEIQLIAAEPDLRKPMNMAFDAAGRLWISESREYPFAAKPGVPARDSIRIFSDFAPDGRARTVTVFADGLNIPIGLHPFRSPSSLSDAATRGAKPAITWKCIAWGIPNIWLLEDTDGDGKADKREVLFGPLGWEKDTHGNQASFRRGMDGWIYATHGFNNTSTFRAKDGSAITLHSGNTYRFRPDGSRIEQHTWGQVNPFGMCMDPLGNFYTADCHSSPIYQLIPGAHYPSFGKPHDGLGYAPTVIQHSHGSTAIGGIVYLSDPSWPAEFHDNILVGNVMTSRINRDQITFHGSSPKGKELADFLSTTDPWFRPVDMQFGPDGALYIADFYNRIIGHYEVPLTHPARDRERGRLWRVVYKGNRPASPSDGQAHPALTDFTQIPTDNLTGGLMSKNPTRRALAFGELELRADAATLDLLRQAARGLWHFRMQDDREGLLSGSLWLLQRRNALNEETLLGAIKDRDHAVRVHALRLAGERGIRSGTPLQSAAITALKDENAHVQRAAVEALARHPDTAQIQPLLSLLHSVSKEDAHLRHATRIALRNQLLPENSLAKLDATKLTEPDSRALADIAVAVMNAEAGAFLLEHLQRFREDREVAARYLRHAVRHATEARLDGLAAFVQEKFTGDLDTQLALFKSVQEGTAQRGAALRPASLRWGADLAAQLLASAAEGTSAWSNSPLEGAPESKSPWAFQERSCADGAKAQLMSSLPNGEPLTGALRSAPFPLPPTLSFYLCGHDGLPTRPAQKKNFIRLRDAETQAVLRTAAPPRNDTAQKISWDLAGLAGKRAFLEVTDGDGGDAYAWLAFGRIEPALPQLTLHHAISLAQRRAAGAELARTLQLKPLETSLAKLFAEVNGDAEVRAAAARALLAINAQAHLPAVSRAATDPLAPAVLRDKAALALAESNLPEAGEPLIRALRAAPRAPQVKLAVAMAGTPSGGESLLTAVEARQLTPQVLLEKAVKERLEASRPANFTARFAKLTQGMTTTDGARLKLIEQRRAGFGAAKTSVANGAKLFTQACAACHRIGDGGGLVGPQLDGIGNRGLEHLLEDILDPNRNVDPAFRTTVFVLKEGESVSGLFRREEGATIVYALANGQEARVAKADLKTRRESDLSLMPENFGEALTPADFNDLLAFLLSQKGR